MCCILCEAGCMLQDSCCTFIQSWDFILWKCGNSERTLRMKICKVCLYRLLLHYLLSRPCHPKNITRGVCEYYNLAFMGNIRSVQQSVNYHSLYQHRGKTKECTGRTRWSSGCTLMPRFPWTLMLIPGAHGDAQSVCGTKGRFKWIILKEKKHDSS